MIGLPHRVGAALVVLGQSNGSQERKGHVLNSNVYGNLSPAQFHTYYGNYPQTEPSLCIVKTAGTIGATIGNDVQYTEQTLPKNALKIICYRTEIDHFYPDAATEADTNTPPFSTQTALYFFEDGSSVLNTGTYPGTTQQELVDAWNQAFNTVVADSFSAHTEDTNLLNLPWPEGVYNPTPLWPRYTSEDAWDRFGFDINPTISIEPDEGDPYYQTRDGPPDVQAGSQSPAEWICPWKVAYDEGSLYSQLQIQCDFSYQFTNQGEIPYPEGSVEFSIVRPWGYGGASGQWLADECGWQYTQDDYGNTSNPYPEGAYRSDFFAIVNPNPSSPSSYNSFVEYKCKATHGLFLDSRGSCWNIGTELKVKVYIWKTVPKVCFYPNNKDFPDHFPPYTAFPISWCNWQRGLPTTFKQYESCGYSGTRLSGPVNGRGPYLGFQTGQPSGIDYTFASPLPVHAHYWGCMFAPDYESEECVEHEVKEYTVVVSEGNTYECDGTARPGVAYTSFGVKLHDIVLPQIEGYITYIKDYEVTSVKGPDLAP
jgi:hypothetical protein